MEWPIERMKNFVEIRKEKKRRWIGIGAAINTYVRFQLIVLVMGIRRLHRHRDGKRQSQQDTQTRSRQAKKTI